MTTEVLAPAKINLTLHVTGQRDDGYHLLDSLVVFAGTGDRVRLSTDGVDGAQNELTVTGPFAAGVPADGTNLILRAAALMQGPAVSIHLEKCLPPSSGIGGGSSDAAATLRALTAMGFRPVVPDLDHAVLGLGADVPVCLAGRACRMQGIGEHLSRAPVLPPVWLLLVNPGCPVPTGAVFAALGGRFGPAMDDPPPGFADARGLADWLVIQRNDLQPPALRLAPPVSDVLAALGTVPGCLVARMSGSGGTCFGLFADETRARAGAALIRTAEPGWWVEAAPVLA